MVLTAMSSLKRLSSSFIRRTNRITVFSSAAPSISLIRAVPSASEYELKVEAEPKKAEKKSSGKLRTKTEQLCGARRQEIISFAEKTISQVADGSARIKEIEGAALENTVIRFVLLMNGDDSRFKEDIAVSTIREAVAGA